MNVAGDWLETGSHRNESVGRELPGPAQIRPGLCCIARPLQFFRLLSVSVLTSSFICDAQSETFEVRP